MKTHIAFLGILIFAAVACVSAPLSAQTNAPDPTPITRIMITPVDQTINPGVELQIKRAVQEAENHNALLLIEINTPGGLLTSTRNIVSAIMESDVPVVAYVTPAGGQAASAGMMITIAAHFAAMAPGTNIGAAHPVAGSGQQLSPELSEKMVNDTAAFVKSIAGTRDRNVELIEKGVRESASFTAEEAAAEAVVDGVFNNRRALIAHLETHILHVKDDDAAFQLSANATIDIIKPSLREQVMTVLGHPNIAYLLLAAGSLGLYIELTHPGFIFPGVMGGICLLLGLTSLQMLPFRWGALALFLLGFILLTAELFIPSFGFLGIGGIVALVIGSLYLFDVTQGLGGVDFGIVLGVVIGISTIFLIMVLSLAKLRRVPKTLGAGHVVGKKGVVESYDKNTKQGTCFVQGEIWNFMSQDISLDKDDAIRITDAEGLSLFAVKDESVK